ncbi:hypothetical protein GCM10009810_21410 [Nostocoides vanveenii]|uniref:Uncharacterized protein n=1 Tax=Nostocoides vanveenii TaxID=330835 RepID=A0ABP4WSD0_9MICO
MLVLAALPLDAPAALVVVDDPSGSEYEPQAASAPTVRTLMAKVRVRRDIGILLQG